MGKVYLICGKICSGKTYYARVRAYVTYGGTTEYGAWSKVKSTK